jgi:RHS repeat-associated protein
MKKRLLILLSFFATLMVMGQNIPRPNIEGPKGFTVNSFTGNLFYQRTDLTLRGTGFPLYSTFYYNAVQDTLDYGYGTGWSFYYHALYKELGDTLVIQRSDAKKDSFRLVNGVYKSPTGVYDSLYKTGATVILKSKDGLEHIFADATHKKLTGLRNRNGNFVSVVYSGTNPVRIRNSSGRCLVLNWQQGRLAEISDSAAPAKKYTYQYDNSKLQTVTNPLGDKTSYAYAGKQLVRMADENGNPLVISYTTSGRVKSIQSCNTEQSFTYIDTLKTTLSSINSARGVQVTRYLFDEKQRLKELGTPDNKKLSFIYDAQNNIAEIIRQNGRKGKLQYSANGNMLKETDARGFATELTYHPTLNKPSSIKDKRGNTTSFGYDAAGNLTTVIRPGNITESFTYNGNGQLLRSINGRGDTIRYEYNANGDLVKIQSPIGAQQFEYGGGCCNLSRITDANGNNVFMQYDLMNRLLNVKDDLNNTTSYQYDAAGNVIKETDPNGYIKRYGYDASNRLTSVQIPVGTWRYEYDGAGNFIKMRDAKGNLYQYEYDLNNRLVKEADPLNNATTYTYDDNGNLLSKREPKGNMVSYQYDAEDQLTERAYEGNIDKYSYDGNGNLVSASNSNIAYLFEYNALDQLVKKAIPGWNKTIAYTYDSAGNRSTMTDPDGGQNRYFYDRNSRLVNLINHANLNTGFVYDDGGRLLRQNNANGTYTTYSYDAAGRVDSILHRKANGDTIGYSFYSFDQYGNRKTLRDGYGLHQYNYDSAHRLTTVQYGNGDTEGFAMDANGNRTKRVKNSDTTQYSYNAADQLQNAGASSYSFDPNGNMEGNTETGFNRVFKYDGLNRLTEVQVSPTKKWQVNYDPFGEKIEKIDTNGVITRMLYDGDNLLGEMNAANTFITKYTTGLGIDQWLNMQQGANPYFFQRDGLNSTIALSNTGGNIENSYRYDVYGNIVGQTGSLNNRTLYTGRLWEKDLGLYDYRNRMYDSKNGRFIKKDEVNGSIASPNSINNFVYVENSPIGHLDYDGFSRLSSDILTSAEYLAYSTGVLAPLGKGIGFFNEFTSNMIDYFNDYSRKDVCWAGAILFATGEAGKNFGIGKLRMHEALDKIGINKVLRKFKILGNRSSYTSEARRIMENITNIINGKVDRLYVLKGTWTKINNQLIGIVVGKKIESTAEKLVKNNVINKVQNLFNPGYNICVEDDKKEGGEENYGPPPPPPDLDAEIPIIAAFDPNEIIGPAGYDAEKKWVSVNAVLPYKVLFENDPDFATAPAQKAIIYLPIPAKLNPASLRLGNFGFGSFVFTVPENTTTYTQRLDVRDSLGVFVDVTAGLNNNNNRAFWIFESIDPATGLSSTLPANKGFLPVNDSTKGNGEGFVTLTMKPIATAQTRDSVIANASIVFDINEPIITNNWVNVIDAKAPQSRIDSLPPVVEPAFVLHWQGQDDSLGVGLNNFDLYVSKNGGPFNLLEANLDSTSYYFVGEPGATYGFITRAVDYTGNREPLKASHDQFVTVRLPNTTICPGGNISFSVPTAGLGYSYQWQVDSTGIGNNYVNITNNNIYSGASGNVLSLSTPPTRYYGSLYRCVISNNGATIFTAPQTLKFSLTWTGNVNTAWENPANWSCAAVPDEFIDIIIPTGSTALPVINSNAACRSLLLRPGTSLDVVAGYRLDIKGK